MKLKELQRLMAADAALVSSAGLQVSTFAAEWKTSRRTVVRILRLIRALGREHHVVTKRDGADRKTIHRYDDGVIRIFAQAAGLPSTEKGKTRVKTVDQSEVLRLRRSGMPATEVARRVGCSVLTVYRICRDEPRRVPVDKEQIRELALSGKTIHEIAAILGCGYSTVSHHTAGLYRKKRPVRVPQK